MEKSEVLNEMFNTIKEMEILWEFHPDNPNGVDVKSRYEVLEGYLKALDKKL